MNEEPKNIVLAIFKICEYTMKAIMNYFSLYNLSVIEIIKLTSSSRFKTGL